MKNKKLLYGTLILIVLLCSFTIAGFMFYGCGRDKNPISPTTPANLTISVGLELPNQPIQPLLGVNAGPLPSIPGDPTLADLTTNYQQIGIRMIRNHDYYQGEYSNPLDMHTIYPDETKDPSLETSYNFTGGDNLFSTILEKGFEIYFRLGNSYGESHAPTNFTNWKQAAVHVVEHYYNLAKNSGKALQYVEIWNEPDNPHFWDGTTIQFFTLFAETAIALKNKFPDLKIGGPGFTPAFALSDRGQQLTNDFLQYMKDNNVVLDFFSWHMYSDNPTDFFTAATFARSKLNEYGYTSAESHITEYDTSNRALRTQLSGAAIVTAAWIILQEQNITVATYYRGNDADQNQPMYGLFYADGTFKPTAFAFSFWSQMVAHSTRLNVTVTGSSDKNNLKVLAGKNSSGEIALLIANTANTSTTYELAIGNSLLGNTTVTIQQISNGGTQILTSTATASNIAIGAYGVQLVTFAQ